MSKLIYNKTIQANYKTFLLLAIIYFIGFQQFPVIRVGGSGKGIKKEYEQDLKVKYEQENIIFKGFMKPEQIYSQIDILIVPSLWNEPFGRIVPEANSYGIPVLVSNMGGLPELVINSKNGYIFDPDIDGDFEEKLALVLEMYKNNKFEFDLNAFGFDEIIGKYLRLYIDA